MRKGVPENVPFVETTNPIQQLESTRLPLSALNRTANNLAPLLQGVNLGGRALHDALIASGDEYDFRSDDEFILEGEDDFSEEDRMRATGEIVDTDWEDEDEYDGLFEEQDEDKLAETNGGKKPYTPGSDEFPFKAPPIWEQAHKVIADSIWDSNRKEVLKRLDFDSMQLKMSPKKMSKLMASQELMERDRA